MSDTGTEPSSAFGDALKAQYDGEGGPLFWLALKTGFLTLITLGIYRFWAKTRIRRYLWSSIRPGGSPFEYTGTGLEMLLGFLLAVVVLAVYLGVFQLILFAVGLSMFSGGTTDAAIMAQMATSLLSFAAVAPLLFFARYRARRYQLARTRWRGIRFGIEKGALGYTWRAVLYAVATILSFGLLLPLMTFRLEKYMIDRTYYGTARFEQHGKWTMLYRAMRQIFIALAILIAGAACVGFGTMLPPGPAGYSFLTGFGMMLLAAGYVWISVGAVSYSVQSFRLMAAEKELGNGIRFDAQPRTGSVIGIYIGGTMLLGLCVTAILIPLIIVAVMLVFASGGFEQLAYVDQEVVGLGLVILTSVAYVGAILMAGALAVVFITQPILRHYIETLTILNAGRLDLITQRERDEVVDAEGFADALDIGAGF
ncbi:YjgN family protein [Tropicimonas sp. IMCC34011]|uniref:YjgN family protein n=1 Tax=Tropicimonas sp. IMCC34011 TaxID=2248759 RepID=UPI000E252D14|nr:DUF898 family protein [Tropicimonas sp. IMCC34011]